MSRRKNGRSGGGEIAFLLAVVAMVVIGGLVMVREYREARAQQAAATPTQAATTPAPTRPDTQSEATNPTEKPKGEALKQPPDGAPSNPLFLAWSELGNGVSSGDAEAVVKKYGDYANLDGPFVSRAKAGDTYVWKWESQNKEWRTRLQYSIVRFGTTLGVFYTQEHVDYTKTMAK